MEEMDLVDDPKYRDHIEIEWTNLGRLFTAIDKKYYTHEQLNKRYAEMWRSVGHPKKWKDIMPYHLAVCCGCSDEEIADEYEKKNIHDEWVIEGLEKVMKKHSIMNYEDGMTKEEVLKRIDRDDMFMDFCIELRLYPNDPWSKDEWNYACHELESGFNTKRFAYGPVKDHKLFTWWMK